MFYIQFPNIYAVELQIWYPFNKSSHHDKLLSDYHKHEMKIYLLSIEVQYNLHESLYKYVITHMCKNHT